MENDTYEAAKCIYVDGKKLILEICVFVVEHASRLGLLGGSMWEIAQASTCMELGRWAYLKSFCVFIRTC